jgi:hypothetical protein
MLFVYRITTLLVFLLFFSCGENDIPVSHEVTTESFDRSIYKLDEYVGAETCAECHQESHEKWLESHHYHAMELPNDQTVRADFNNSTFENYGITTRFFRENEKYLVETENQSGEMEVFEVAVHLWVGTPAAILGEVS